MDCNKLLSGLTSSGVLGGAAGGAAAAADGHLDSAERQRIMARLEQLELAPPEKTLLMDGLQQPPSGPWLERECRSGLLAAVAEV